MTKGIIDLAHVVFDLETTSLDTNTARIVAMAFVTIKGETILHSLVNPLEPIPPAATKVHGITDAMASDAPTFADQADDVQAIVQGAILCGYSSRRFDVPILDRELRNAGRAGIDLGSVREIDAHQVWIAMRPRTLVGAFKEFCGEELHDAHDALADCRATADVIRAMALCVCTGGHSVSEDCDAFGKMESLSKPAYEIDRAGKFKRCPETGRALLNFGKHRGEFASDHPGFLKWMLRTDFPEETKQYVDKWMSGYKCFCDMREGHAPSCDDAWERYRETI